MFPVGQPQHKLSHKINQIGISIGIHTTLCEKEDRQDHLELSKSYLIE